jgi:hypothetical protein
VSKTSETIPEQPRYISRELFAAVKLASQPAYVIGRRAANLEPPALSRILRDQLRPADEVCVRKLAKALGVPLERAFSNTSPITR